MNDNQTDDDDDNDSDDDDNDDGVINRLTPVKLRNNCTAKKALIDQLIFTTAQINL